MNEYEINRQKIKNMKENFIFYENAKKRSRNKINKIEIISVIINRVLLTLYSPCLSE